MLGEFEILEPIGVGGMGVVYRARQQALDRTVAVKVLQPSFALDTDFLARFRNEAVLAAGLNHPNIVQVYAAGQTEDLNWFAMECVEGESLQGRLSRKGRLDPAEAIAIVLHVVTGLEYAWRKARIIHRDIKPDNIFLSYDGEVKLGDLGLAKSDSAQMKLTLNGVSMGTPHYVSPEHAEGREDLDLRADIYSLGATLYHLISGVTVYSGSTPMSVLMKHLSAEIPDICSFREGLPPVVAEVVTRMLQKAREDRYADYQELGDALRVAHEAISSWRLMEAESVEQVLSANAEGGGVLLREGFAGQEVASGEFAAAKTEMSEEELVAFTGMERALDALEHVERSQPSMGVFPPIGHVKRCREALGRAGYAIAKGDSLPWEVGDGVKGAVDTLRRRLSAGAERVAMINGRLTRTIWLVLLGWVGGCLFAVAVTHLAAQWRAHRESVMKEK